MFKMNGKTHWDRIVIARSE